LRAHLIIVGMVTELRDYRIADGHLGEFVAAWSSGVRPLRERAGFATAEHRRLLRVGD
jgi:hypothetical protein